MRAAPMRASVSSCSITSMASVVMTHTACMRSNPAAVLSMDRPERAPILGDRVSGGSLRHHHGRRPRAHEGEAEQVARRETLVKRHC